jgi:hypothetical protein
MQESPPLPWWEYLCSWCHQSEVVRSKVRKRKNWLEYVSRLQVLIHVELVWRWSLNLKDSVFYIAFGDVESTTTYLKNSDIELTTTYLESNSHQGLPTVVISKGAEIAIASLLD